MGRIQGNMVTSIQDWIPDMDPDGTSITDVHSLHAVRNFLGVASNSAKKVCAIDKSSIQRVYIGICVELSNSVLDLHGNIQILILGWIPKFILTTCLWVAEGL